MCSKQLTASGDAFCFSFGFLYSGFLTVKLVSLVDYSRGLSLILHEHFMCMWVFRGDGPAFHQILKGDL